ncbi:hypothetical protein LPJ59_001911 [Coemansia sp. RSA 2399]|nr:hypothetical protein LPJ59_001911 [Coemansia sp. RSA 2399]
MRNANDILVATAPENIPTLPGFEKQAPTIRYSIDELLLLQDSSPSQIPIDFSPYTPLRLGSQVKPVEPPQGLRVGKKIVAANPFMGLENIPRSHKEAHQTSQKAGGAAQQPRGQSAGMNRVSGVSRGSGRSQGTATVDNSIDDHSRQGGSGSRGASTYPSTTTPRDGHGRAGARHNSSNPDGNRTGGALSWRSSAANRSAAGIHVATDYHGNSTLVQGTGQPEWMDNDMLYDESVNARRMQDMEDWKRHMKESSGETHSDSMQDDGSQSQPVQHAVPGDANNGLARGSRFLRLFSESAPQQGDVLDIHSAGGDTMQAHTYAYHNTAAVAAAYANGVVLGGPEAQSVQAVNGSGDQISKLFKVLGDRISVNNSQPTGWTTTQTPESILSNQNLAAPSGVSADPNRNIPPSSMPLHDNIVSAMSHPQGVPSSGNTAESRGSHVSASNTGQQTDTAAPTPHRLKTASPAPINEALRGIVPTSVFRKSVQSSSGSGALASGGGSRQNQRSESITSSRSGTPAKHLPSWLVELSRGRSASPTNNYPAAGQAPVTNESLGSQDLVDVLEREFPTLGIRPQHADNQSISSLSVQASVGVPSEGTGGGSSVRHSTIETPDQENQQSSDPASQLGNGSNGQLQASEAAVTSYQMMAPADTTTTTATPRSNQVVDVTAIQNPGTMALPETLHNMQHVLPPQAMMDMPPPMMLPDGTVVPGMMHHPPMMGGGQMPPMAMMPPPHPAMGFHPNMMFGMMPPHPGMFGNMPPASMPMSVGQMNGIPGPTSEHQQQMIKMMMMSDMPPPGMMFGQMNAAGGPPLPQHQHQHQHQHQQQYQHQQQMPPHMPAHPAPNGHMYSAAMAQQPSQAFHHQNQHQPYEH